MTLSLFPPLQVPDGEILRVLGIARVSKSDKDKIHGVKGKHDEPSLDDQEALLRRWLDRNYGKPYELTMIASTGSGECLDREESARATAAIESRRYHLSLTEDLGRIFRRIHAYLFCETCEDSNTRLIALNDFGVDTGREDWRMAAFFAVMRHESYNRDTAARIRRSLRNRFVQGGIVQFTISGYVKPPGAKTEDDVSKSPAAEPVYDEWFRRLENEATFSEIADWLEIISFPVGPHCRSKKWTGRMVRRITFNPILKGLRVRNSKIAKRVNKTGRRKSIDAPPEDRLERNCPHLAFITPERYDRVIRMLRARNACYARGRSCHTIDSRKGVSKKRTIWPGQHLRCGRCKRLFYWGGHGQKQHMMCSGSRDYLCWNAVTFDGGDAARRLTQAILAEIENLPEFDATFLDKVKAAMEARQAKKGIEMKTITGELDGVQNQLQHVSDAIAQTGIKDILRDKLTSLISRRDELQARMAELDREPEDALVLPPMEQLKDGAREAIVNLATDSPEFGRLMKRLVPRLMVYPYRLCDGGAVVLRAKFTLDLALFTKVPGLGQEIPEVLRRELVIDLFEPPQRVRYREQVMAMRASGMSEKEVAKALGLTVTAVQRAASLNRMMQTLNLSDPYVEVMTPPADCTKLRRHLHPRYRFKPIDDDDSVT